MAMQGKRKSYDFRPEERDQPSPGLESGGLSQEDMSRILAMVATAVKRMVPQDGPGENPFRGLTVERIEILLESQQQSRQEPSGYVDYPDSAEDSPDDMVLVSDSDDDSRVEKPLDEEYIKATAVKLCDEILRDFAAELTRDIVRQASETEDGSDIDSGVVARLVREQLEAARQETALHLQEVIRSMLVQGHPVYVVDR